MASRNQRSPEPEPAILLQILLPRGRCAQHAAGHRHTGGKPLGHLGQPMRRAFRHLANPAPRGHIVLPIPVHQLHRGRVPAETRTRPAPHRLRALRVVLPPASSWAHSQGRRVHATNPCPLQAKPPRVRPRAVPNPDGPTQKDGHIRLPRGQPHRQGIRQPAGIQRIFEPRSRTAPSQSSTPVPARISTRRRRCSTSTRSTAPSRRRAA